MDLNQQAHDTIPVSYTHLLPGKIADKTLDQLEREGAFVFPEYIDDAEDITRDQIILQSVNDSYRSCNVMGFIGCGNERLIIESRFSGEEDDYFFQYLIDRVLDFPNLVDLETDANQDNRLFNFLLFLFPYYLKTAMRKGLFKEYIRHNYNDGYVKGTIDIARHIEMCIRDRHGAAPQALEQFRRGDGLDLLPLGEQSLHIRGKRNAGGADDLTL